MSNTSRGILTPAVEEYLYGLLRPRDKVLTLLEKDAQRNDVPIVGPLVGNLLSLIAETNHAKKILEVGTATGYSGIWLGRVAKKNGGKLFTIENDPVRKKIASKSFQEAGIVDSVEIVLGDAKEEVPKLAGKMSGEFDVVFIDVGDKTLYVELIEPCIKALRTGGFLVADNTLWRGLVASSSNRDPATKILREYNKRIYADKRFQPIVIPLRDGVTVAMKIADK